MPCSMARFAAPSAASAAAYGVLLREPLNPAMPAEPHEMTFPDRSVIVTIVLLKLAWMWTCPWGTFLRSRRRCLTARLRSAMPHAPVRPDLDEALDVQRHLATEVALDLVGAIDDLAEPVDLVFREVPD